MSYDVGAEKPDSKIFNAAERIGQEIMEGRKMQNPPHVRRKDDEDQWVKVYVGDDFTNDVVGARDAGWNSVFVGEFDDKRARGAGVILEELSGKRMMKKRAEEVFLPVEGDAKPVCLRAGSVEEFLEWLVKDSGKMGD